LDNGFCHVLCRQQQACPIKVRASPIYGNRRCFRFTESEAGEGDDAFGFRAESDNEQEQENEDDVKMKDADEEPNEAHKPSKGKPSKKAAKLEQKLLNLKKKSAKMAQADLLRHHENKGKKTCDDCCLLVENKKNSWTDAKDKPRHCKEKHRCASIETCRFWKRKALKDRGLPFENMYNGKNLLHQQEAVKIIEEKTQSDLVLLQQTEAQEVSHCWSLALTPMHRLQFLPRLSFRLAKC